MSEITNLVQAVGIYINSCYNKRVIEFLNEQLFVINDNSKTLRNLVNESNIGVADGIIATLENRIPKRVINSVKKIDTMPEQYLLDNAKKYLESEGVWDASGYVDLGQKEEYSFNIEEVEVKVSFHRGIDECSKQEFSSVIINNSDRSDYYLNTLNHNPDCVFKLIETAINKAKKSAKQTVNVH